MQKWEYRQLVQVSEDKDWKWRDTGKTQSIQDRLDELGSQGWELVSVTSYLANGRTQTFEFYFKRPV